MSFTTQKRGYVPVLAAAVMVAMLSACSSPTTTSPSSTAPTSASPTAVAWSYTGATGPDHWGDLSPDWAIAKTGKAQSPIDIESASAQPGSGAVPEWHFTATEFGIENNGHTVEPVPKDLTSYIMLDGVKYTFQQTNFHAPSEHTLNGQAFPMEMHLVTKDDQGHIAVIGLFITAGAENQTLKEIFAHVPAIETTAGSEYETAAIDLGALLPANSRVFRYDGSLTTPPCSEGVKWSVYDTPIEMSDAQIAAFTAVYSGNARPVQPLNGRTVSAYG